MIGVGGGKALDTAKLLAHQLGSAGESPFPQPPGATCCGLDGAIPNVYSEDGRPFLYDVALRAPPSSLSLNSADF